MKPLVLFGWDPKGEPIEITEFSLNSEPKLDWLNYHHTLQDGPRAAKKTGHEYDGGDLVDHGERKRERKWQQEFEKPESDGQAVSKWKEWNALEWQYCGDGY